MHRSRLSDLVSLLLVLALTIWGIQPAKAQLGTATILGTVVDSTGGVIVGAEVLAVNSATGFRRQTTSNEQGQYRMPGLSPGNYNVTIEFSGFRTYQRTGLTLQVDQNLTINAAMEVGDVTEVVEVAGQAPLVESTNASLGTVVDQRKITDLPLNGRNFTQLALLVPGANTGAPGATTGGGFTVSGARSEQNAFQIDGTSNSDAFENRITVTPNIDGIQEFKIQTNNYSAEFGKGAGAQVNLVTRQGTNEFHGSAYEFWRNDVVQARRFFDRNLTFACNDDRQKACAPPFNQNQFGFTLGGPLFFVPRVNGVRKTFFFTNYEGFRQRRGNATQAEVPSLAQRAGDFSQNLLSANAGTDALGRTWKRGQIFDPSTSTQVTNATGQTRFVREPFLNNRIPLSLFDPVAVKMLAANQFLPLPNDAGVIASNGNPRDNFLDGRSRSANFDQFSTRIDHQFSDNDTVYGRFTFNDADDFNPRSFPGFGTANNQRNLNGTLGYSKVISPSIVNEFRLGYQGWFQLSGSEDLGTPWNTQFGINGFSNLNPGIEGSPDISITGFTGLGNGAGPLRRRANTYQLIDNLSFNAGRHFMKVGFEVRRVLDSVTRAQDVRGRYLFQNAQQTGIEGLANTGHTFANLLLGLPQRKVRRVSDFHTDLRATEYGFYAQDDFKVSSNLTLNFGLRYQLYIPPKDHADELSTLVWLQRCPGYTTAGCAKTATLDSPFVPTWGVAQGNAAQFDAIPLPRSLTEVDKKNFGPRFGFAYQPSGNSKTVIRGGYAIFYDTVPMIVTEDTIQNFPFVIEEQQQLSLTQFGLPPAEAFWGWLIERPGLGTGPVAQFSPGPNVFAADFRNAYLQNWNFGIQRELPSNMVVEVAYVGNKGTRLNQRMSTIPAEPLGPGATIGDLSNDPTVPDDIGPLGRNQFRLLMPFAKQSGIIVPLADVFETRSVAFSNYHGLEARLEKRYSQGLTLITTFAWSKAISNAAGFNNGGSAGTGNRVQDFFNQAAEKGLADVDHRYRFTTAYVYDLPFGKGRKFGSSWSGALDKVLSGWGLDGILTLQSGYPITVRRSGDPASIGTDGATRPDLVCDPDIPRGEQTVAKFFRTDCFAAPETLIPGDIRFGNAGRSTVQGPGIINWDFSLRKDTFLTERVKLQFRGEVFNMPNHANWLLTGGSRDLGNSNFGVVTDTLDPRIIQFGLKLSF